MSRPGTLKLILFVGVFHPICGPLPRRFCAVSLNQRISHIISHILCQGVSAPHATPVHPCACQVRGSARSSCSRRGPRAYLPGDLVAARHRCPGRPSYSRWVCLQYPHLLQPPRPYPPPPPSTQYWVWARKPPPPPPHQKQKKTNKNVTQTPSPATPSPSHPPSPPRTQYWVLARSSYHLVGRVVRRPPREREIRGSVPAYDGIFPGSSHTSDLVATGYPVRGPHSRDLETEMLHSASFCESTPADMPRPQTYTHTDCGRV